MSTISERVQNGVVYLDHLVPNWIEQIDLKTLDMEYPEYCVFGQIYGDYHREMRNQNFTNAQSAALGLSAHVDMTKVDYWYWLIVKKEYEELTEEWTRVITERREKQCQQ